MVKKQRKRVVKLIMKEINLLTLFSWRVYFKFSQNTSVGSVAANTLGLVSLESVPSILSYYFFLKNSTIPSLYYSLSKETKQYPVNFFYTST